MRVGIDLFKIERIKNARDSFFKKIYTRQEIDYCKSFANPNEHFAGIFSAKEAVMKALGYGLDSIPFKDIEVLHNSLKQPYIKLFGIAKNKFEDLKAKDIQISISHTETDATAICVII